MATFQINDNEWYALSGLSYFALRVYCCLRRRMDFATGLVGKDYSVSHQSIIDESTIPPKQGAKGVAPTKNQVRVALSALEKAGLIVRDSAKNKTEQQAIYKLILADFGDKKYNIGTTYPDHSNQNTEKNLNSDTGATQPNINNINASSGFENINHNTEENANNNTGTTYPQEPNHHNSLYSVNKTTTNAREGNFQMFLDWLPDLKILNSYLIHYGFGMAEKIPIDTIKKFTGHWSTRTDLFKSEAKWCEQLARWHKSNIERGKANANSNRAYSRGSNNNQLDLDKIANEEF